MPCLPGRHAQSPVEADDLAIEHRILANMLYEGGILLRPTKARGKGHACRERILNILRHAGHHRRIEDARRNGDDANSETRELARGRKRQGGDAALRRSVGGLADLPVESGDRGGIDDHPPARRRRPALPAT